MNIESVNIITQIIVNITIILSFIIGWGIYVKKFINKKKKISLLKKKINELNNLLPSDKSIDDLLSKTKKEDGKRVQIIISTNDGRIIDSTKESIDEYFRKTKKEIETTINELQSSIDDIAAP